MNTNRKSNWMKKAAKWALGVSAVVAACFHPMIAVAAAVAGLVAYGCRKIARRGAYAVAYSAPCGADAPSKSEVMRSWVALY